MKIKIAHRQVLADGVYFIEITTGGFNDNSNDTMENALSNPVINVSLILAYYKISSLFIFRNLQDVETMALHSHGLFDVKQLN